MSISSSQLDAFAAVCRTLNFSRAAQAVHVTQSALSQRIQNLEKELGLTLFIRDPKAVRLTESGSRLLRYCQAKEGMETELMDDLRAEPKDGLGGELRIAGYSTVMSSAILPALAPFLRANPRVRFSFSVRETRELPAMLRRGEADFIILDRALKTAGIEAKVLGMERYVLAESSRFTSQVETYLDNDPEDTMTERFFQAQSNQPHRLNRTYLGGIEGILRGVTLGLGRAVVPRHLITKNMPIRIAKGFKTLEVPIVLHYFKQPYYSRLHQACVETLARSVSRNLVRLRP